MKIDDYRLVLIEWIDSIGAGATWSDLEDVSEPPDIIVKSVGWLVIDGEKYKTLVPHIHDEVKGHCGFGGCGEMAIPTVAIRNIFDLNKKRAK